MPRTVCRVVTLADASGRYGGPWDTALNQADVLHKRGWDVSLVAGALRGKEPIIEHLSPGLEVHLRTVHRWLPTRDFTGLMSWALAGAIWRSVGSATLVHISMARETIPVAALLVAVVRGRPVILQPHGMLTARTSRMHRLVDLVLLPLFRSASSWIALTAVEADDLRRAYGDWLPRLHLIGNPVPFSADQATVLRALPHRREAVFIGRLHSRKRVRDIVAAAEYARSQGWSDEYVLVGPDQGELGGVQKAAEQNPFIRYEGPIPGREVPGRLARASVFVLPSSNEPWGNVLAMALSLGMPCVIASSAALAATVSAWPQVRIYPDGDFTALARAVHDLMSRDFSHWSGSQLFDRENTGRELDAAYRAAISS